VVVGLLQPHEQVRQVALQRVRPALGVAFAVVREEPVQHCRVARGEVLVNLLGDHPRQAAAARFPL
jgi:hypothetical protein